MRVSLKLKDSYSFLRSLPTALDESRPPRPVTGGARRITKEERERQEREAEREAAGTHRTYDTCVIRRHEPHPIDQSFKFG